MMKKILLFKAVIFYLLFLQNAYAQIGIGIQTVESDLLLKTYSSNKGVLIPNLNISNLNLASPVTATPTLGLLAYNTAPGKKDLIFGKLINGMSL